MDNNQNSILVDFGNNFLKNETTKILVITPQLRMVVLKWMRQNEERLCSWSPGKYAKVSIIADIYLLFYEVWEVNDEK